MADTTAIIAPPGGVILPSDPTDPLQAATKKYVDEATSGVSGAVSSVFGRIGDVVAQSGDYSFPKISGTVGASQLPATISSSTTGTASNVTGVVAIANGGTGSTTATASRTSLGAAASGANSDITSLSGLTTPLSIAQGGTGATTAAGALVNLGALSIAGGSTTGSLTVPTLNASSVNTSTLSASGLISTSAGISGASVSTGTLTTTGLATVAGLTSNGTIQGPYLKSTGSIDAATNINATGALNGSSVSVTGAASSASLTTGTLTVSGLATVAGLTSTGTVQGPYLKSTGTMDCLTLNASSSVNSSSLSISGTGNYPLSIASNSAAGYIPLAAFWAPNNTGAGNITALRVGVNGTSEYNCAEFALVWQGSSSTANRVAIGMAGNSDMLDVFGSGNVSIGSTADTGYKLFVNGSMYATAFVAGKSIANSNNCFVGYDQNGTSQLQIATNGASGTSLVSTWPLNSVIIESIYGGGLIFDSFAGGMKWQTSRLDRMAMDASGNVSIYNGLAVSGMTTLNNFKFTGAGTATSANAGSASALPSAPAGYWVFQMNGTWIKIPYYNG